MIDMREIYNNKLIIGQRDDFDSLIKKINSEEPDLEVIDNYDRTMTLKYKNQSIIERFQDVFEKVLPSWLEREITCPIQYTYNIFPLNSNQSILRI